MHESLVLAEVDVLGLKECEDDDEGGAWWWWSCGKICGGSV